MIYLNTFYFPSLPEKISVNTGTTYQTYNLLDRKVAIPNGMELKSVKWSGVFFGKARQNTVLVKKWIEPENCVRFLEDAIKNNQMFNLIIEEAPINLDVTISQFSYEASGVFGDISYTIELQESSALQIYTISEMNIQPLATTTETRPEEVQPSGQAYVIVSGDNLWKIARKFYGGSGSDWKRIYDANAAIIEATAQQHGKASSDAGHWIYPGCTLTIP